MPKSLSPLVLTSKERYPWMSLLSWRVRIWSSTSSIWPGKQKQSQTISYRHKCTEYSHRKKNSYPLTLSSVYLAITVDLKVPVCPTSAHNTCQIYTALGKVTVAFRTGVRKRRAAWVCPYRNSTGQQSTTALSQGIKKLTWLLLTANVTIKLLAKLQLRQNVIIYIIPIARKR